MQIEQERSEEESSVGDVLALAFRCARFCSASLILFASYSPAPLFMRPRHFVERVDGGRGGGDKGGGGRGKKGRDREILGAGIIPKFVVFYRFYSIFMYFNAITGYQKYLIDILK